MTAYEDAIRRVVDDARTVRAQDPVEEPGRRAAVRGAAAAATAGMLTVAPAVPAMATTPPVEAPAQDVADVLVQDLLGATPGQVAPEPATVAVPALAQPSTGPVTDVIDDVGEVIGDTVDETGEVIDELIDVVEEVIDGSVEDVADVVDEIPDVVPGIRPPVIIPLDGRDTEPPPRQTDTPVVVVPPVRPDTPAGGRFPTPAPPAPDPDPDDGVDVPERPTPPVVPVIVGSAPPPAIQGAGTTDITEDFSDLDDTVTTTPIPLGGVTTHVVRAGDSLWSIATDLLADADGEITVLDIGRAVEVIYDVNRDRIGPDPDQLAIGIELEIPEDIVEQLDSDDDPADASTDNTSPTDADSSDG